jgi:hypothetical protein
MIAISESDEARSVLRNESSRSEPVSRRAARDRRDRTDHQPARLAVDDVRSLGAGLSADDELRRQRVARLEVLRPGDDLPVRIRDECEIEREPRFQRDEELAEGDGVPGLHEITHLGKRREHRAATPRQDDAVRDPVGRGALDDRGLVVEACPQKLLGQRDRQRADEDDGNDRDD